MYSREEKTGVQRQKFPGSASPWGRLSNCKETSDLSPSPDKATKHYSEQQQPDKKTPPPVRAGTGNQSGLKDQNGDPRVGRRLGGKDHRETPGMMKTSSILSG